MAFLSVGKKMKFLSSVYSDTALCWKIDYIVDQDSILE